MDLKMEKRNVEYWKANSNIYNNRNDTIFDIILDQEIESN